MSKRTVNLSNPDCLSAEDSIKLHEVAKIIYKARKTTFLTGAGISCNAGIPDFRSDDGLYNIVKAKYPTSFIKGQDLFDISLFRNKTTLSIFCTFMEGLYKHSLQAKATETHKFIKTLKEKNKLLRCYTQNIDSIEKTIDLNCGINSAHFDESDNTSGKLFRENWKNLDVVQLHGNLHKLCCTQCFSHFEWTPQSQLMLEQGEYPECENCHLKYQERLYSGKRLTGNIGILRPDIVLYGENHPQSEILAKGLNIDLSMRCDLLLIMGTSLKVDGVKKLVRSLSKTIRERGGKVIFVNKTPLSKQWAGLIDYEVLGDCDEFVKLLKGEIPDLFLTQEQLDSKKLKAKGKTTPAVKVELKHEVKEEAEGVKLESDVLTPPTTPSKMRTIQLPKIKPSLKRKAGNSKRDDLPSPSPSFTEDSYVKVESELDAVSTDCDDDELPLKSVSVSELNRTSLKRMKSDTSIASKRVKVENVA